MRRKIAAYLTIITIIFTYVGISFAILPAPPVVKDISTQQYFKELYDNHDVLTVITSSPNGVRQGASGEVVIVHIGAIFKLWVNQGGTVWVQI